MNRGNPRSPGNEEDNVASGSQRCGTDNHHGRRPPVSLSAGDGACNYTLSTPLVTFAASIEATDTFEIAFEQVDILAGKRVLA